MIAFSYTYRLQTNVVVYSVLERKLLLALSAGRYTVKKGLEAALGRAMLPRSTSRPQMAVLVNFTSNFRRTPESIFIDDLFQKSRCQEQPRVFCSQVFCNVHSCKVFCQTAMLSFIRLFL